MIDRLRDIELCKLVGFTDEQIQVILENCIEDLNDSLTQYNDDIVYSYATSQLKATACRIISMYEDNPHRNKVDYEGILAEEKDKIKNILGV